MDTVLIQVYSIIDSLLIQLGLASSAVPSGTQQLAAIIIGVFLILLVLALARHHMLTWSMKGAKFGVFLGIILTLALEGFLLVAGKTTFAEIVKSNNVPPAVSTFLSENMSDLAGQIGGEPGALGASTGVRETSTIISDFKNLGAVDKERVQEAVCKEQ